MITVNKLESKRTYSFNEVKLGAHKKQLKASKAALDSQEGRLLTEFEDAKRLSVWLDVIELLRSFESTDPIVIEALVI
jgi:hypothetical protein